MDWLRDWARGLPARHGRTTLVLLGAILVVGFGLRAFPRLIDSRPRDA